MIRIGSVDDVAADDDAESSAEVSSTWVWPQVPRQRVSEEISVTTSSR